MGARRLSLGVVVMVFALAACGPPPTDAPSTSARPTAPAVGGLVFSYGVGAKNVLDTTRGRFTKDMILASPITVPMELSAGEMARIFAKLHEIGFFSYPAVFSVPSAERGGQMTPFASYRLAVKTDTGAKVVTWDDRFGSDNERALRLRGLARLIESIIVAKPDYRRLPEPQGGYL